MTTTNDSGAQGPVFPAEIFSEIVHKIDTSSVGRDRFDCKATLRSCSLVCRQWQRPSQRLLFHSISLSPGRPSSRDFIRQVAQGSKEASRFTDCIKFLRIGGGLGDPRFEPIFPRFAEKLPCLEELQFAWVDAMRWDRLPLPECEAFIHLSWLPSLKTVGVSHVAGYFPFGVSTFFGPNVETLKLERARIMRIITPTLGWNLRAQLAKFHLESPDSDMRSGLRPKHIKLGWKEDIKVLADFASFEFDNFFLDSLQTFTVQREESSSSVAIDIGRFFGLCPNLKNFEIYPNAPHRTEVPRSIGYLGRELSVASMNRSGAELTLKILHLRREPVCDAFFEWINPYLRRCPEPGAIARIDIVDTWCFDIYDGDIQGRQGLGFLLRSLEQMDEIITSRFHNLERVCLTLNIGQSSWSGRQEDLLQWLQFPHLFSRLRAGGVFMIKQNIIPE